MPPLFTQADQSRGVRAAAVALTPIRMYIIVTKASSVTITPLAEADVTQNRLERKKNKTRQALLDNALSLFAERGIYSPSIEEVTEGADLGKGTFYKYFHSREDLIAALVRQGFDGLLDQVAQAVEGVQEKGAFLKRALEAHSAFFHAHHEYLLLFHQARGWLKLPGEQKSPVRQEFERYVSGISDLIPAGSERRRSPAEKRRKTARVLAGFISGVLSFHYILDGGIDSAPDLVQDIALLADMINK